MTIAAEAAEKYVSIRDRAERLDLLKKLAKSKQFLPLSLVEDIMCMEISTEESIALVSVTGSEESLAVEDFITRGFMKWEQDIALAGIARWMTSTPHVLSHRWLCFNTLSELPQRLRYSFVSNCDSFGGEHMLRINSELTKLLEYSPAFVGLLLLRCAQWNISTPTLLNAAESIVKSFPNQSHHDRMVAEAITYLATVSPKTAAKSFERFSAKEPWYSLVKTVADNIDSPLRIIKEWQKGSSSKNASKKILSNWPALWIRQHFDEENTTLALQLASGELLQDPNLESSSHPQDLPVVTQMFAGIPSQHLLNASSGFSDTKKLLRLAPSIAILLQKAHRAEFVQSLRSRVAQTISPQDIDKLTTMSFSAELKFGSPSIGTDTNGMSQAFRERNQIIGNSTVNFEQSGPQKWTFLAPTPPGKNLDSSDFTNRRNFFDVAYRNGNNVKTNTKDLWTAMTNAWSGPQLPQLDELATLARRAQPLFQIAYINTLGRFRGMDAAVLKLLDFVRSPHDTELSAVIRALAGIATPRALQELVSCLTRPNMSLQLRLESAQLLSRHDLSSVQDELRSALADLHLEKISGSALEKRELEEALEALVAPGEAVRAQTSSVTSSDGDVPKLDLDIALTEKISTFPTMSSEVKRALRTAEFFHRQVGKSKAENSIDLSPLIDMQYKALELTFREQFEDPCNRIINQGIIQRKLDFLGYARPIPSQMDQFEGFIAGLPVVNTIPYFSKFKMRKMLRSLCQFRPGKRFTLDGLKAFAIFFACFSRKSCRFGLENIFELPFKTDEEMAQFVKMLHVFQDFRNRAAHEGFQPDAKNDVIGIWRSTADIFTRVQLIDTFLKQSSSRPNLTRAS